MYMYMNMYMCMCVVIILVELLRACNGNGSNHECFVLIIRDMLSLDYYLIKTNGNCLYISVIGCR